MAGRPKGGGNAEKAEEREATQRVVFKRERVLVLPEGVTIADIAEKNGTQLRKVLGLSGGPADRDVSVEAWVEVARAVGSQQQAIESHAGKPNTPDAKPGAYRTTPARSWKGGRIYTKPPEPKVEAEELV